MSRLNNPDWRAAGSTPLDDLRNAAEDLYGTFGPSAHNYTEQVARRGVIVSDHINHIHWGTQEESMAVKPDNDQLEVQRTIADVVAEALGGQDEVLRTWTEYERTGPMGGVSAQVTAAVDLGDRVVTVAVNVYCSDDLDDKLDTKLEQERRARELREALNV